MPVEQRQGQRHTATANKRLKYIIWVKQYKLRKNEWEWAARDENDDDDEV